MDNPKDLLELNILIEEKVFGKKVIWKRYVELDEADPMETLWEGNNTVECNPTDKGAHPWSDDWVPDYSGEISAALKAVEKVGAAETVYVVTLEYCGSRVGGSGDYLCTITDDFTQLEVCRAYANTASLAICLAIETLYESKV